MLGGAPEWRPHMFVSAEYGAGKSKLAKLVEKVLGAGAHPQSNSITEAGIRQAMTGEARAIILDEAEAEEGGGRVRFIVELLRRLSSGAGLQAIRGTPGGKALNYSVTGCVYLSAVLAPFFKPADRSRIAAVRLLRLTEDHIGPGRRELLDRSIAELGAASPALRARAIARWPLFLDAFEAYRARFVESTKDPRPADQIATLLAGRDLLLEDTPPDERRLGEAHTMWQEFVAEAAENESEGAQCLMHLLTQPIEQWRDGTRRTLANIIMDAIERPQEHHATLGGLGVRVEHEKNTSGVPVMHDGQPVPVLFVANDHAALAKLFEGTRWAGRVWQQALRYLDGATPQPPLNFGGVKSRSTRIPARHLPEREVFRPASDQKKEHDDDL